MGHQRIFLLLFVFIWFAFIFAPLGSALDQESAEELYETTRFKKEAEGDPICQLKGRT